MLVEYIKYDKYFRKEYYWLDTDDLDDDQYYKFRLMWGSGNIIEAKEYLQKCIRKIFSSSK